MGTSIQVKTYETPDKTRQMITDELRRDFEEWLSAKEDEIWRPPFGITEKTGEFDVTAIVAGVDLRNVEIIAAPDIMLIKGKLRRNRDFPQTRLSRPIRFPRAIDPDQVHAEINDGVLTVKAQIAAQTKYLLPLAA